MFLCLATAEPCYVAGQEVELRHREDCLHWWGVWSCQETVAQDPPAHWELAQILQRGACQLCVASFIRPGGVRLCVNHLDSLSSSYQSYNNQEYKETPHDNTVLYTDCKVNINQEHFIFSIVNTRYMYLPSYYKYISLTIGKHLKLDIEKKQKKRY